MRDIGEEVCYRDIMIRTINLTCVPCVPSVVLQNMMFIEGDNHRSQIRRDKVAAPSSPMCN